ncbi:unnamed protein product [Cuscuta campestris]|uniref:Uncharacterized protein n=1 Tax=Cuscuta campestris TaxID=132261 RepID=A0A484MDB7_9ASTE|nr:unnamed protein product [Cuscuta campestris]
MKADKILSLPKQPPGVKFGQYSGYVTVDPRAGRSLFYYLAESPHNSSAKPLVLWLTGGPGCTSLGFFEIGPYKVRSDGKTLYMDEYAWNNVANVLFVESPAGVGFSYSNTSSDYNTTGDRRTAKDSYTFLVNWFQRFPHYKKRHFYITGQSYCGHFIPQLAHTIVTHNNNNNQNSGLPFINLKGIAVGNGLLDSDLVLKGISDFLWGHAMSSDETHQGIIKNCDFARRNYSGTCQKYLTKMLQEYGNVPIFDVMYSSTCVPDSPKAQSPPGLNFNPCSTTYVQAYLNRKNVQRAFHTINTTWRSCSQEVGGSNWKDAPRTVLPIIKKLIANRIRIWLYSGDQDGLVPVTSTRYAINMLKLPVVTPWRPWYSLPTKEVGGYVEEYDGLTLVTIREAGHAPPSYQPERALTMISSFLEGKLPPSA